MARPLLYIGIIGPTIDHPTRFEQLLRGAIGCGLARYSATDVWLLAADGSHHPQATVDFMERWLALVFHRREAQLKHARPCQRLLDSLVAMSTDVGSPYDTVVFYCDWVDQDWVRLATRGLFPNSGVEPINCDASRPTRWRRRLVELARLIPRTIELLLFLRRHPSRRSFYLVSANHKQTDPTMKKITMPWISYCGRCQT